jgi:protein SDA1
MLKYELLSLLQLQNLIKRDPSCYEEEFKQQLEHFNSNYEIFRLNPSSELEDLEASVAFLSHVSHFYPNNEECKRFPLKLLQILEEHGSIVTFTLRRALCRAVILLNSKNQLSSIKFYKRFNLVIIVI